MGPPDQEGSKILWLPLVEFQAMHRDKFRPVTFLEPDPSALSGLIRGWEEFREFGTNDFDLVTERCAEAPEDPISKFWFL